MEPLNLDMVRRLALERQSEQAERRRQMQVDGLGGTTCMCQGVRYECSGKPGSWLRVEDSAIC